MSQWSERMQNRCHFYSLHVLAWHNMNQWLFLIWSQLQQKAPSVSCYNRRHLQYPGWQRYTFLAFCHLIMIFVLREAYVDAGIWPLKWEIAVHPILQGDNYLFSCLSWDPKWDELSKVHNPHFCMVLLTWRRQCNIYFFKSQDWLCALAKGTLFPQRPLEESFYSEVGSRSAQSFYHLLLPQCGLFPPKY